MASGNPIREITKKPSKVREEGELSSSSDDEELPTAPTSISTPASSSFTNVPRRTSVQNVNSGKSSSANTPDGSAHNQSQSHAYRKGYSKNQVLLKSSNSGRDATGPNDNLVISFSDDDESSSDCEERREGKAPSVVRHSLANTRGKPPALPHVKLQNVRSSAKNEGKVAPEKASLSRIFISSMTKVNRSNVKSGGSSFTEKRPCLKNPNVGDRILASQDPGCSKNVDLSSSKLHDLRQQIAMRESELKRKLTQQSKEIVSETCRKVNVTGRKCKSVSADGRSESHPEEPERKRLKSDATGVTVSCSLSDWISRPKVIMPLPTQTLSLTNAAVADSSDKSHPGVVNKYQPSRSASNQDMHENSTKANDHCDAVSGHQNVKCKSDSTLKARSMQVSDSMFESPDASPDNTAPLHCLGKSVFLGSNDVDRQSLFELEELHDKELEEAQEHRRHCEVEERNALKAYRQAQRALVEANSRCTYLYRRRELYSAQLRSFMMEDSSLYSSRQHSQLGEKWTLANNVSKVNVELMPPRHQLQDEFDAGNQLGYDSNVQSANGDLQNRLSANDDGQNLGSEACSEPDASTSELLGHGNNFGSDGFCPLLSDLNLSPGDDNETYPVDHRSVHANGTSLRKEDNTNESAKDMGVNLSANFSLDARQDSLRLEEYLRSKLVSRLGVSSSRRNRIGVNSKSAAERVAEEDLGGAKSQIKVDNISLSEPTVCNADCAEAPKEPDDTMFKLPTSIHNQQQHVEEHSLNASPLSSSDHEDSGFPFTELASTSIISSSPIYRSAMKAAGLINSDCQQIEEQHYGSPNVCHEEDMPIKHGQDKFILGDESCPEKLVKHGGFGVIDSYTSKSAINPFWPLCTYELRGRCNNDECPWQHTKDYSSTIMDQNDNSDCDRQTGSSSNCLNQRDRGEVLSVLTPPRYLISLGSLKGESHAYGSLQACHFASSQKNIFSYSLAVSSSLLKHLPSNEPCLHGNDGCVESYGGGGHSLYFQSRNRAGISPLNGVADNEQSLEMALTILSQEVNKLEGMKKALSVLSRALEADTASSHLWIIYLFLYYSAKDKVGDFSRTVREDDIFSHAVKHNEQSYELWLLYINSRRQLNERIAAYERALSRLCHHASTSDGNLVHTSAAILDLFLQMLHCFSVSGNVTKAIQRIHELVPADRDSNESHSLLLFDILQCLTISDKCIFWVCCVYLVIYRKLPDSLVQQFEFEKDISVIEWPSVHLTFEEKQQVSQLMRIAVDSVGFCLDRRSVESSNLKSAHLLVHHIKLIAAIDGVESCKMYLENYRNSCSSCLDFILFSARAHDLIAKSTNFEGFEKALINWPKDVPGSQCIWNQFAEYALEKARPDKAKEIMERWFHCVWKPQFHDQSIGAESGDKKSSQVDPLSRSDMNALASSSNMDVVFGLLNLSLYKLLQNDVLEAHLAIDKALKVADAEVLRHCVKEHAAFLFNNGYQLGKDVSVRGLLGILKSYTVLAQAIPAPDPLTRKFTEDIRKPRSRQLVTSILSPILPDSFVVNSVLKIWFGLSLLPQKSNELKDMVDFVEAVLEVSPANYELVISVCKLLCREASVENKFASVLFWASSLLVNTIYQAVPLPPEHIWVVAGDLLAKLTTAQGILESFYQRALSVCPFSIKLWKSYLNLSMDPDKRSSAVEEARHKGLQLD